MYTESVAPPISSQSSLPLSLTALVAVSYTGLSPAVPPAQTDPGVRHSHIQYMVMVLHLQLALFPSYTAFGGVYASRVRK